MSDKEIVTALKNLEICLVDYFENGVPDSEIVERDQTDTIEGALRLAESVTNILDNVLDRPNCIYCASEVIRNEMPPSDMSLADKVRRMNELAEQRQVEYPEYSWEDLIQGRHKSGEGR